MMSKQTAGFRVTPLPGWIRAANGIADAIGFARGSFIPERIMTDAGHAAGLPPDFPPHVHEAVDVLCRSIREEANLHALGVANNYTLLGIGLAQFLLVEKMFADDPSLINEPLLSPIVVVGMPRSGTTFLHRLLAAAPDAVGVSLSRHLFPVRPKRLDYRDWEAQAIFFPWLAASKTYDLDAVHFVRPHLPDECNFGMRLGGKSMIYWSTNPVHSYLRWLLAQDAKETYRMYRKVLILHQRAHPGQRLTLKCPQHLAWLPALAEALPEATIVQTHRDPVQVLPSESKLILSCHGISVRDFDWKRSVESNYFKALTYAERSIAFADSAPGQRTQHIDYMNIVRDPVGVAADVHRQVGLPFTDGHRAKLASFAAENRQHKHGTNVYKLGDYGLDAATITKDFAAYRERFLSTNYAARN